MTYYQSRTLKQILIVRNCWKKELDNLKEKIKFLETENNALKAENIKQMKNEG